MSLWHKRAGVATNESAVSGGIWTKERSPLCLLVVGHCLHQDEEEEGEADHEVQQAEVDGAEGAVEGGEGEAEEEEVLVETDEQQVEGSPA